MAQDAKARIDELRKALDKHNYNYYVLNAPEISDYEFDMMMEAFRKNGYPRIMVYIKDTPIKDRLLYAKDTLFR